MEQQFLEAWLQKACAAAREAGAAILEVYHSADFGQEAKSDNSPLTLADRRSHEVIMQHLAGSGVPVLSEEGRDIAYAERSQWPALWVVDPLDGTKEFIKKNGEFTVNIALVENHKPILGVVYVPVLQKLYYALEGKGAFLQTGEASPVPLSVAEYRTTDAGLKMVGSRSHMNEETVAYLARYQEPEVVSMGSSLKFMLVAEGAAHEYPRLGPTMEWDTAAAQAVVTAAGGLVLEYPSMAPLAYNRPNLLNPYFVVRGKLLA